MIAPETASNGKEGGSLLPTLFFGIPGSSGMAVLLGAFLILGIQPGATMMTEHLDLVWTLIWALVVGNLIAVRILLVVCRWVAVLTFVNGRMLVPFILVFVAIGCFVSEFQWQNCRARAVQRHRLRLPARRLATRAFRDRPRARRQGRRVAQPGAAALGLQLLPAPLSLVLIAMIVALMAYAFYRNSAASRPSSASEAEP